ncbi:hypothetical protein ABEV04_14980 [Heyndrickxia faecalis]|uniref:hypothetical protein n=1 Tax=Heyndrickxia TaxID=2837504 RepID=UPI002E205F75|nr:hypothetical protein [Weizmannia sp. CD-2023]
MAACQKVNIFKTESPIRIKAGVSKENNRCPRKHAIKPNWMPVGRFFMRDSKHHKHQDNGHFVATIFHPVT